MITNNKKIKCPYCGAEYVPSEVYIPTDFLPKFTDLEKDEKGQIVSICEQPMNTQEEYTCDYCNHRFSVVANVTFTTAEAPQHDYNFDYETKVYDKDRLTLSEN